MDVINIKILNTQIKTDRDKRIDNFPLTVSDINKLSQ